MKKGGMGELVRCCWVVSGDKDAVLVGILGAI